LLTSEATMNIHNCTAATNGIVHWAPTYHLSVTKPY